MADPKETRRSISEPSEQKRNVRGGPVEEPGHTRTQAEGEEEGARRDMPQPPPGKTPGKAEG